MSYSPFTDDMGKFKTVYEVTYKDLVQLNEKEIVEGYKIEYKSTFSDAVFKKLPKIICSFANERGGWLFIGIDDKTQSTTPILFNHEYELKINSKIASECCPVPKIVVRFLQNPENQENGVLLVYIPMGDASPYICNGTVYRRVGSGSSPIEEVKDRYYIDKLYERADKYKERINSFCCNRLYYRCDVCDNRQETIK
jgi:predicted HTH transcriptional regulator